MSETARQRQRDPFTRAVPLGVQDTDFAAKVQSYATRLPEQELSRLQVDLARAYLRELDRRLRDQLTAAPATDDAATIEDHLSRASRRPGATGPARVGLVSMPWMAPAMPSIQLATLSAALESAGMASDRHELFVDYASTIGIELYKIIANTLPFTAEWVFSRHYFGPEAGTYLHDFYDTHPDSGMFAEGIEDEVLDALGPVTEQFLLDSLHSVNWGQYDVVGFSLTISQVASSLALARLIKREHPGVTIVFGGAGCAGVMGKAILRISPYVDAVVHVEGEPVLPELVRRIQSGESLSGLDGVSSRSGAAGSALAHEVQLYRGRSERPHVDYDPYFARVQRLGLADRLQIWVPFEGSRGCWWGQKVQCSFCGLHEIMKFRDWKPEDVLAELDHLYERHGITRFFAVDLILPKEFHETLLPELAGRQQQWTMFYEVKADMSRADAERLAAAGIRWIQPGIESLDHDLLRLIRKGTWPAHNVQLLRWCAELGIKASWNLLTGIPGATRDMYDRMISRMPLLFHLMPPSGCGEVQLHRFSPYFDDPAAHGIRNRGPHRLYRSVFPVSEGDLADLVYLHEFDVGEGRLSENPQAEIQQVVDAWRAANERGAALDLTADADGGAVITDTRLPGGPTTAALDAAETALYRHLDTARVRRSLPADFAAVDGDSLARLGGSAGLDAVIDHWMELGLVYPDRGRVVALAVDADARARGETTGFTIPFL